MAKETKGKPETFRPSSTKNPLWVISGILLFIISILYVGLNTFFSFQFEERRTGPNYAMLAEAFVSGQVYLKKPVDPQRLKAADPLDPSLPYPFIDDAIIWKGRYYFQQEPFPALIRAAWLKLAGVSYPTGLIVVVCLILNVLWIGGILWLVRQAVFPESPIWVFWFVLIAFALSGPQLYIASRPIVHHESTAMGGLFALGAVAFLSYGLTHVQRLSLAFLLSGLLFGMAILCRAWLGLYPVVFFLCFGVFRGRDHESFLLFWRPLLACAVPIGCFIALQLLYNFLRFHDLFDFGRNHVIYYHHFDYSYLTLGGHFFRIEHVPFHLYHYLLALPLITEKVGLLRYPVERIFVGDVMVIRELASSIFIMVPILALALPFPLLFRYRPRRRELSLIMIFCGLAPLIMLTAMCFFVGATARYLYDFTPLIFVVIFYNLAVIWNRVQGNLKLRRLTVVGLSLLFGANCIMGLFLAFTGMIAQR